MHRIKFLLTAGFLFASLQGLFSQSMRERPVVLQLQGMDKVDTSHVVYKKAADTDLRLDVYYPPNFDKTSRLPVVIFNNGVGSASLPDWRVYQDWAKLVAVSGMVAVNYQSQRPHEVAIRDTEDLIEYLRTHAAELAIDPERIGVWTCSANAWVGVPLVLAPERNYIRCAVIYYGMPPDINPRRQDISLLVVRAGLDSFEGNKEIEQFMTRALRNDLDITFINYLRGVHGFDVRNDTPQSRAIIRQTLTFLKNNLLKVDGERDESVFTASSFYEMILNGEVDEAARQFRTALQQYRTDDAYDSRFNRAVSERSMTAIGYRLLQENHPREAVAVFNLLVESYPNSPNAHDSLGDGYEAIGEKEAAVQAADKALQLLQTTEDLSPQAKEQIRKSAEGKLQRLQKKQLKTF